MTLTSLALQLACTSSCLCLERISCRFYRVHRPLASTPSPPTVYEREPLHTLVLGAIGVVFGDIGTSPLYALKECFSPEHGLALSRENVLGVLSLIVWALTLVVSIKYLTFIMRADNRGEGGVLAMLTLILRKYPEKGCSRWTLIVLGLTGTAMFYGDSMITPAVSVLSAVEGLHIAAPAMSTYVLPITLAVLTGLFLLQYKGTGSVGRLLGPVTLVWFLCLGYLGICAVLARPDVLAALSPQYAFELLVQHPWNSFLVFGSVFLVLTGAEALYADMGHFGRSPIRLAWFGLVMPCLLLNYFGQGALLLHAPESIQNPFYLLAPPSAQLPLVLLATLATVIASQAVIAGAFSVASQAVQLGYCPRMQIRYTSSRQIGQVYVPFINWTLFTAVVLLVVTFQTASNLASAYGIAVATTMLIDTLLFCVVVRIVWRWSLWMAVPLIVSFAVLDLVLLASNVVKIGDGGWLPLLAGLICYSLLITWRRGRRLLYRNMETGSLPIEDFLVNLSNDMPHRVPGTAIFMTGNPHVVPNALLHNLKHNKVIHERVVILNIGTSKIPHVPKANRVQLEALGQNFYRLLVSYGFKDKPDVRDVLHTCNLQFQLAFDLSQTSFFLARETVIPSRIPGMARWGEAVFSWMFRNATRATDFFGLPPNRVVELGAQVEI